jgi:hypothetical protein
MLAWKPQYDDLAATLLGTLAREQRLRKRNPGLP